MDFEEKAFFTMYAISKEGIVFPIAMLVEKEPDIFHLHSMFTDEELIERGYLKKGESPDKKWYYLLEPDGETMKMEGLPFCLTKPASGSPFRFIDVMHITEPL